MVIGFEVIDYVLPIRRQDITGCPLQALVDLGKRPISAVDRKRLVFSVRTFAHVPVYSSATGANPCAASY
jgi:hypothetical protein